MQAAKNTAASAKQAAANVAASAKSGMEKTKATMQEKVEKMSAHDAIQKDMATQKKEEKVHQAECNKQEARENNAAAAAAALDATPAGGGTHSNYTAGGRLHNHPTSGTTHDLLTGSNLHGHGTETLGANTGPGLDPRATDAVYPDDADFGAGLKPIHHIGGPGGGVGGMYR